MGAMGVKTEREGSVNPLPAAVVLTVSPTGLAVARSLAPRGVPVYPVDSNRWEIGHFSRWFRRGGNGRFHPPGEALVGELQRLAERLPEKPVLFVAGDAYLDFVSDHHEILRKSFILADSMRPEVNSQLVNKRSFYRRCLAAGIDLPVTFFPESEVEARHAAEQLRYPAIVKPELGHITRRRLGGAKVVLAQQPDELVDWWRRIRDWGSDSVLQEVIEGPEANIFVAALYTDASLRVRSLFTARKCRQYPPMFGSGSYLEACWSDEIAELSTDLVSKLGYRGVCGTEYKWDARDGMFKLIELNPRPTLWFSLCRAAGVDVIWDAYCDLIGRPGETHIRCQDDGTRWQFLLRDLLSSLHFLSRGELSPREWWRTAIDPRRKNYAALSLNDPGLALGYPANALWKWWSHRRRES